MNLQDIREQAVRRQQIAHQNRSHHRDLQKQFEKEDHALQAIIRRVDKTLKEQAAITDLAGDLDLIAINVAIEAPPQPKTEISIVEPAVVSVPEETAAEDTVVAFAPEPAKPAATDADVLLIMRANRNSDGLCLLRPSQIAKEVGAHIGALNVGAFRRLAAAGHIKNLGAGRFLVHDKLEADVAVPPVKVEAAPAADKVSFSELTPAAQTRANRLLAAFQAERSGSVSSVEKERLYRICGSSHQYKTLMKALVDSGAFRESRSQGAGSKDCVTVLFPRAAEAAE